MLFRFDEFLGMLDRVHGRKPGKYKEELQLVTTGGIACDCTKCGPVSQRMVDKARWKLYKGVLLMMPIHREKGCIGYLRPTNADQLAQYNLTGAEWITQTALYARMAKERRDAEADSQVRAK